MYSINLHLTICLMCVAGNPRVTPEVTRDVCLLARMMAANLYFSQIEDLMFEVSNMVVNTDNLFFFSIKVSVLTSCFLFVPGSCLCGAAMMSYVFVPMNSLPPQGEMQNIILVCTL